jgi:hypothetical protein
MHTAGGQGQADTYLFNIYLPNGVMFPGVRVAEAQLVGDQDVLIGMDIITSGDFSVTNCEGQTCMSFRWPSLKRIDYVPETNKANAALTAAAHQKQIQPQFQAQIQRKHKRHR